MKLSEFIDEMMYEIALGIDSSKKRCKDYIAINPSTVDGFNVGERSYVDFDVSISVEESETEADATSGGGKAKVSIASIAAIGGEASHSKSESSTTSSAKVHRVTFKVPVYFAANYKNNPEFKE